MLKAKEIVSLVIAGAILGYLEAFQSFSNFSWIKWLIMFALCLLIVFIHSIGQKITALFFDASSETHLWEIERFGLKKWMHFRKPFPAFLFFPLVLLFATFGYLKFLAVTTFETSPLPLRISKFAKLTELQLAVIALGGCLANVFIAFIFFFLGYKEFAILNLYFVFFNLIPISNLDGSKVLFGSRLLWVFSMAFVISLMVLLQLSGFWVTILSSILIALAILVAYYCSFE